MKLKVEAKLPNGDNAVRRYWGVSFHAEKRKLRAAFRPEIIGKNEDGTPITDEGSPAHEQRLEMLGQQMAWGDPDFSPETVTRACYIARIRLLDKQWHVGTSALPIVAARLYDSALFHLWGWGPRSKPHFNFYRPDDPTSLLPDLPEKVRELQLKIKFYALKQGLVPEVFSYTFAQRNDH